MANPRIAYLELLGIPMAGHTKPDQGLYWTDLTDWWGLPSLRGETDSIPGGHGRFQRVRHLRESRVMTLTGHILTASNRELVAVRDNLEATLAQGSGILRVVTEEAGTWDRYVDIDTLKIEPDHGRSYTKFTVDMEAMDPRRYGPEQLIGPVQLPVSVGGVNLPQRMPWNFGTTTRESRLVISNPGSISLHPVILVDGGFGSVSVIDVTTGRRLSTDWEVPTGSTLVFDSASRRAEVGSSDVTRWMTRRQWFEIKPGATHEFRFEATSPEDNPQMWGKIKIGAW